MRPLIYLFTINFRPARLVMFPEWPQCAFYDFYLNKMMLFASLYGFTLLFYVHARRNKIQRTIKEVHGLCTLRYYSLHEFLCLCGILLGARLNVGIHLFSRENSVKVARRR